MIRAKFLADLLVTRPSSWTCEGSSARAACSLFWTWTCAVSGLVPWAKVMVTVAVPDESLAE